jgi:branched-chain amino acid transport system permease protein
VSDIFEYLVRGVLIGVTYGLLAYPISLIYVAKGSVDLAVGSYAVLAAAVAMLIPTPLGYAIAVGVAVMAAGVVGLVSNLLSARGRVDDLSGLLASFGFAIVLESIVLVSFGKDPMIRQSFASFWRIGGVNVSPQALINVGIGLVILATVYLVLYKTPWGRVMRASAINPRGATLAGIPVAVTQWSAFVVSGILAGIGGLMLLHTTGMDYSLGLPLTLKSLGAAILFGLGSPIRGFFGGILIGLVETLSIAFAPQAVASLLPFLFIFAVLCMSRESLMGAAGNRA